MSENGVASCEENYSSDPGEEVDVPIVVHLEQRQSENDDSSELDGDKATGGRYFAGGTGGSQRCFNCGLPGHLSRDCPEVSVREFEGFPFTYSSTNRGHVEFALLSVW